MRFTKRDLRSPQETLGDICETVKLTRADIIFLNTLIGMANESHDIPKFQKHNLQIAQLLAAEEMRPGVMSLIRQSPRLFDEHVAEYAKKMAKIQEDYYQKHPDKRPVPVGEGPVTSPFKDDTGDSQSVDAEAQPSEQTKVEPEQV